MKAVYQGLPGAFSHQACLAFLPGYEPVPVPNFAAVIAAVVEGRAEAGVLPVENNAAGPVTEAVRLLAESSVETVAEHVMPIRMHLLGLRGSELSSIRTAVSHPVALRQCARTLSRLGLAAEEAPNTAVAASRLDAPSKAVLASEAAAGAYGLTILLRNVHDRPDNATRFKVIVKRS